MMVCAVSPSSYQTSETVSKCIRTYKYARFSQTHDNYLICYLTLFAAIVCRSIRPETTTHIHTHTHATAILQNFANFHAGNCCAHRYFLIVSVCVCVRADVVCVCGDKVVREFISVSKAPHSAKRKNRLHAQYIYTFVSVSNGRVICVAAWLSLCPNNFAFDGCALFPSRIQCHIDFGRCHPHTI